MNILSIETSCDESAVTIIKVKDGQKPSFETLGNNLASQIELHKQYGGVFPMMAKREHSKNLIPLLIQSLKDAKLYKLKNKIDLKDSKIEIKKRKKIEKILDREPELYKIFIETIPQIKEPKIDLIAVTYGPGLEPALWVGINLAKALAEYWDVKVIPVNHMEGHIFSVFIQDKKFTIPKLNFPALSLLISGGHTELVLIKDWLSYKIIGQTVDDAVGEAFDKVARMLDLPYPGGPEISKLALLKTKNLKQNEFTLPRPMLRSPDFNFSFSGLKTAVLYLIKKIGKLDTKKKIEIAKEFQDSVIEVLTKKTFKAIEKYGAKSLIIAGGVAANKQIKNAFTDKVKEKKDLKLYFPTPSMSTDNSVMIGVVGYFQNLKKKSFNLKKIKAIGNLKLK